MLQKLGEGIWCARQDLQLMGCNFGARMTVVRLADGTLWLYSPIKLTAELKKELDALGQVAHVISPNAFHHIFVSPYLEAYPQAKFYGMPELSKKRPELTAMVPLTDLKPDAFGPALKWVVFNGRATYRELLVCHPQSGTLLVCDIAFNLQIATTVWERVFLSFYGVKGKFGPSIIARLMAGGRTVGRETWPQILAWDFQRVVPCHGEILDRNARAVFRQAFHFME